MLKSEVDNLTLDELMEAFYALEIFKKEEKDAVEAEKP